MNRLSRRDLNHRLSTLIVTTITYVAAAMLASVPASSVWAINFQLINSDGPGEGFNDPVLGSQRASAFQHALDIWSGLLGDSYVSETIKVQAKMDPLAGTATSAVLGNAFPTFYRDNDIVVMGVALSQHLAGMDLLPQFTDITATFNSAVDGTEVLADRDWYYGTDGQAGADIDFVSVVLHEIAHGLSFESTLLASGGFQYGLPTPFDNFLVLGSPQGVPIASMTMSQRQAALTSDNVYWSGPVGIAANSGIPPKIHAPADYRLGSSMSHLDETTYPLSLMSPFYSGPNHRPSRVELAILADIGWTITVPEPATPALLIGALACAAIQVRRVGARSHKHPVKKVETNTHPTS
jgi:hypothetical protein